MKFLIAFAFFAMASAVSIEPVKLPEPAVPRYEIPDIRPLIVPAAVMEAVRLAELSGTPLDVSNAVKFVDAPVAEESVASDGLAVNFVDVAFNAQAVNAEETAQATAESVYFFQVPLEEVQPTQDAVPFNPEDFAVKFVDAPLEEAQDAAPVEAEDFAIKIVEAPLPVDEQIIQRETVVFVEEPLIDQMQPRLPGKQYADPRLRGF